MHKNGRLGDNLASFRCLGFLIFHQSSWFWSLMHSTFTWTHDNGNITKAHSHIEPPKNRRAVRCCKFFSSLSSASRGISEIITIVWHYLGLDELLIQAHTHKLTHTGRMKFYVIFACRAWVNTLCRKKQFMWYFLSFTVFGCEFFALCTPNDYSGWSHLLWNGAKKKISAILRVSSWRKREKKHTVSTIYILCMHTKKFHF